MITTNSFMIAMIVGVLFLVISTTLIAVGLNVLWKEVYVVVKKLNGLRIEIRSIRTMEELKDGNERTDDSH